MDSISHRTMDFDPSSEKGSDWDRLHPKLTDSQMRLPAGSLTDPSSPITRFSSALVSFRCSSPVVAVSSDLSMMPSLPPH